MGRHSTSRRSACLVRVRVRVKVRGRVRGRGRSGRATPCSSMAKVPPKHSQRGHARTHKDELTNPNMATPAAPEVGSRTN